MSTSLGNVASVNTLNADTINTENLTVSNFVYTGSVFGSDPLNEHSINVIGSMFYLKYTARLQTIDISTTTGSKAVVVTCSGYGTLVTGDYISFRKTPSTGVGGITAAQLKVVDTELTAVTNDVITFDAGAPATTTLAAAPWTEEFEVDVYYVLDTLAPVADHGLWQRRTILPDDAAHTNIATS